VLNQDLPCDYCSNMHYGMYILSRNGRPTIIPRQTGAVIGQANKPSPIDIAEVRHFYGCTP
jgi:hypothetical protein